MPVLSIITITYNAEKYLERTLKSVGIQTNKSFEYLLIDGNSTDSTLTIAKKHSALLSKVISEPDGGLYDAMNKGLRLATGDYVWFVNAGDEIATPSTMEKLLVLLQQQPDVVYGETYFTAESGEILGTRSELTPHKLPDKLHWKQMALGMLVCHQSFIVKRALAPTYIKDNLSADVDWEIKVLKKAAIIVKYEGILSKYLVGGISNQQLKKSLVDRFKVLMTHFGLFRTLSSHVIIIGRGLQKMISNKGKYW